MSDNVVILPVVTTLPIPVNRALDGAAEADLASVLVIGYDKDGEIHLYSSEPGPEMLWLLEQAKLALLNISK